MSTEDYVDLICTCGNTHRRRARHTWHNGQCNDCINRWAHDKATTDLDRSICLIPTLAQNAIDKGDIETSVKRNGALLREHQRIFNIWDRAKKEL